MPKRVNLKLKRSTGLGTMECVDHATFNCGGKVGTAYPADSTIDPMGTGGKNANYVNGGGISMPYSVLWIGQRGIYFHEWKTLPGIAGCIHLLHDDAVSFYNWADQKIRVVFEWTD